jgi:hypothetical protein
MFRRLAGAGVAGALAILASVHASAQQPPTLDLLLRRASNYVLDFIVTFSNVVAEEHYLQTWRSFRHQMVGDFLLIQPKDSSGFFALRDVATVDGTPVRDRESRVMKLLTQPAGSTVTQLDDIGRESGRFTFGNVFNSPVAAIALLQMDYMPRFRFTLVGPDRSLGPDVWTVKYEERDRPTIFRSVKGQEVMATGSFSIEAETGRVVRTELTLPNDTVTTRFMFDERFNIDVPVEMVERYRYMNYTVNGTATYGRFRRFGVTTDEKIQ